jgi:hypothetical protein
MAAGSNVGGGISMICSKPGCRFKRYAGRLCHFHAKLAAGFHFDSELGLFVKAAAVRADRQRSATPLQESGSVFPRTQERADVGLA